VNDVEWPTRADPDDEHGTGTVIFGKQPEGGYFQISFLTVKVAEPLVRDVGEYVTLSTPTLGRNDYEEKDTRASSTTARLMRSCWKCCLSVTIQYPVALSRGRAELTV
jgi:hypothetical protein